MKRILLWIGVIPGSLLAGVLATFPFHWILMYLYSNPQDVVIFSIRFFALIVTENWTLETVELFLSPVIVMTVAVIVAYKLAPERNFIASCLIAALWLVVAVISAFSETIFFDMRTFATSIGIGIALCWNWYKSINAQHSKETADAGIKPITFEVRPQNKL